MVQLLLLFSVVAVLVLNELLYLGSLLGPLQTFLIILVTGLVGATLAKREGIGVLRELQDELARGLPPATRLAEGALVVVGGVLLITPGVFTDLAGFLFIIPWTRRRIAPQLLDAIKRRVSVVDLNMHNGLDPRAGTKPGPNVAESSPWANKFDDLT